MALGTAGMIGLGAVSALAGGQGDSSSVKMNAGPASAIEQAFNAFAPSQLNTMNALVNAGPGIEQQIAANRANRDLAGLLGQFAKGGFLPGESDWATANQFAQQAFNPQQVSINQQYQQQQQQAAQLASRLGRPVNDPIIQAKLAQERMQAQERLGASQGAFASQYAQGLPMQRLGFQGQLANLQSGLASQAMANRQALLSLGSQLKGQDMQYRLATATRTQESGGGLAGMIQGGIAGLGAGANLMNMFSKNKFMDAMTQQIPKSRIFSSREAPSYTYGEQLSEVGPPRWLAPQNAPDTPADNYVMERPTENTPRDDMKGYVQSLAEDILYNSRRR